MQQRMKKSTRKSWLNSIDPEKKSNLIAKQLEEEIDENIDDPSEEELAELDFSNDKNNIIPEEYSETANNIEANIKLELKHNKSKDPTDIYLREVGIAPLLTKEEEIYYSRLSKKGDIGARKKMIESNLRLVIKIARKYLKSGMAILDLIEEGNLGLMRAVEKFDPEKGFRFSTYSAWWIQQTIERAIMSQNRTIRLPVHVMKKLNSCLRTKHELGKKMSHEASSEEIGLKLSKSTKEIENTLCLNEKIISIDAPISDNINKSLLDTVGNDLLDPAKIAYKHALKEAIYHWLAKLTLTQKSVVELRFGLKNGEPSTLEETGQEIGLTRERVRQLQSEALKSLKLIIEDQGIDLNSLTGDG
jgi:RNA polymerase nonessential primary-like sigma factor